jgi:hypothetical protein
VDDFGVKYVGQENAQHLLTTLQLLYTVTADWMGTKFLGLTIARDYNNKTVDLSMPNYIAKALQQFQHQPPRKPEHAPHKHIDPQYGAPIQYTEPEDASPLSTLPASTYCNIPILCTSN